MKKLWNVLSILTAVVWFLAVVLWIVLVLPPAVILVPYSDIAEILTTGYATMTGGAEVLLVISLVISLTMLIPPFRRCFRFFPWLYPYVKIFTVDMLILVIAEELLNYGFEIQNDERHRMFILLMIGEIVAGRLIMCWYFHKKPARFGRRNDA